MIKVTEDTLNEITRRLVETYHPEQVVLFGSHAWGEPDDSSDVDLLVVLSESAEPAYRRASAGYRSLFGLGVPCDVWVRTREEVLREAPLTTTLTHRSSVRAGLCMAEPLSSQAWGLPGPPSSSRGRRPWRSTVDGAKEHGLPRCARNDGPTIVEVRSGAYLGEDDIVRLDDVYGRAKALAP